MVLVAVVCLVIYRDHILVGEVEEAKRPLFASLVHIFPGGEMLPHEDPLEAAERECRKGAGLLVRAIEKIYERVHPLTGAELHYVLCRLIEPSIAIPPELKNDLQGIRWVPIRTLPELMPSIDMTMYQQLLTISSSNRWMPEA